MWANVKGSSRDFRKEKTILQSRVLWGKESNERDFNHLYSVKSNCKKIPLKIRQDIIAGRLGHWIGWATLFKGLDWWWLGLRDKGIAVSLENLTIPSGTEINLRKERIPQVITLEKLKTFDWTWATTISLKKTHQMCLLLIFWV